MKTLEVYPEMTLAHLQEHFTQLFPYLQLDLINSDPDHEKDKQMAIQTMDELAGTITHCCFLIEADMSVTDLEDDFRACYGLAMQIKRWTGYAWHDTDETRDWTLDQQNDKGTELQTHSYEKSPKRTSGDFSLAATGISS